MWLNGLGFDKQPKYLGNDFEILEIGEIFEKWLRYMGHGLNILEMA